MIMMLYSQSRFIKIGDKECEYNPDFRLILHTKLANPHYQPEMQAQCTLINFTVTRDGLEDQLLADVVGMERPDLEELKVCLIKNVTSCNMWNIVGTIQHILGPYTLYSMEPR